MVDVLTKKQRSRCMSNIKSKNTKIEVAFRKHIWSKGVRDYRVHSKITGRPDLVFPKLKIAVFFDGCFWHKCPRCYIEPKSNKDFWVRKINRNVKRDKDVNKTLREEGWKVLRFWEHDIKKNKEKCFKRLIKEMYFRKKRWKKKRASQM